MKKTTFAFYSRSHSKPIRFKSQKKTNSIKKHTLFTNQDQNHNLPYNHPTFNKMQKSTSFSDSRNGKTRPANLLTTRSGHSESLPWPSPSFDVFNNSPSKLNIGLEISADPGRPSTQAKVSPTDVLPPTPLTATYKPLERSPGHEKDQYLRLPSVKAMLAHTPPESRGLRTIPLPETEDHTDAPITPSVQQGPSYHHYPSGTSPIRPGFHAFPTHQDVQPDRFRGMPQSDEVQGLGLDLGSGDDTPRLGTQEWSALRTPTMHTSAAPALPGAPHMASASNGQLPLMMTSPINPPLRNWNTDIRFEDRRPSILSRPSPAQRSFSDNVISTPMEREYANELEGGMPQAHKNWGLAISMDNGEHYRRGAYLYRPEGSVVGPATMIRSSTNPTQSTAGPSHLNSGPPTPMRPSEAKAIIPSSASKASSSSKSLKTTGLTPHIHKTRLTPTFSTRSKGSNGNTSPNGATESPSLKMKSKQRSEQLRNQAASVVAQANLPSDHSSVMNANGTAPLSSPLRPTDSLPTSPSIVNGDRSVQDEEMSDVQGPSVATSSPNSAAEAKAGTASSPWGVFELGTSNNKWQPLGPPALSNVLGKLNLDEAGDDDDDMDEDDVHVKARSTKSVKRARKQPSSTALSVISQQQPHQLSKQRSKTMLKGGRRASRSGSSESGVSEGKENDVFGSSILSGRPRTPILGSNSANASPNKTNTQGQRRLLSIR